MLKDIKIGDFVIGDGKKPFIIAEMSGNHNQSLDRALAIVDAAAFAGAHAIKLQTYTADTITFNSQRPEFIVNQGTALWKGKNLYDLYREAHTPWEWHKPIFDRAREKGLIIFSSPFDESSVDFLETLSVPAYKIASFENTHWPLLKKVASTGKPIIMSTGVATIADVAAAVDVLRNANCQELILLKCTSTYPASPESTNIRTIPHMANLFDCHVGLSDHTLGIGVSVASVALGAKVIEKHFTLDRKDGGVDSAFSLEPHELKLLVEESERAFLALGKVNYEMTEKEKNSLQFKRSIYVVKPVKKGEKFSATNLKVIRPALGLEPKHFEEVIGKTASVDIEEGTPLSWGLVEFKI